MRINLDRVNELNDLIIKDKNRKLTIVLGESNQVFSVRGSISNANIKIDADVWRLSDTDEKEVDRIAREDSSVEDKILDLYESVCRRYTYDDNTLSYVARTEDDVFELADEYGRRTNEEWKENRSGHNRRNCFEVSRILAKSMRNLFEKLGASEKYDVCILWDEANVHYLNGFASDEQIVVLDTDDFNQIKDLTRVKTDLTIEGIEILKDTTGNFERALNLRNEVRYKTPQSRVDAEENVEQQNPNEKESVRYLKKVAQILKEEYNLDSAGIFEYMKEIVDVTFGPKTRKKMWKEVEDGDGPEKTRTRCLFIQFPDEEEGCLIDVTQDTPDKICRVCNASEIGDKFINYKSGIRKWEGNYDGR